MTKTHKLQEEAETQMQEDLRVKGLKILKIISKCMKERKAWAAIREEQIKAFEDLRTQLFDAYDAGDEYRFDKIAKQVATLKDSQGRVSKLSRSDDAFDDI